MYGRREVNFFQKYCPIPLEEVRELSHLILMKMLPAVVEQDLDEFSEALWRIQNLGFKKIEVKQYGNLILDAMKVFRDLKLAVGMSSTGAAIFIAADSGAQTIAREAKSYFREKGYSCDTIITKARNEGAEVIKI
jgi:beta-ribofuranosylaminobenzene 5'-phosphate synthase